MLGLNEVFELLAKTVYVAMEGHHILRLKEEVETCEALDQSASSFLKSTFTLLSHAASSMFSSASIFSFDLQS